MMFEFLYNDEQLALRDEARALTRWVPRQLILDMDAEKVRFPREYISEAGRRGLLGIRVSPEFGGRGLGWVEDTLVAEEVGVASYSLACLWGVGGDIVSEALARFGTDYLRQEVLKPLLRGELCAAECLTEPRGGSDFFGAQTYAVRDGDHWVINGKKRFIVGAEGADWFLVYAVTAPDSPPHKRLTAFMVPRSPQVEAQYIYGLMGVRGGGAGRIYFRDVRVPDECILNRLHGGFDVFMQMMVPERLGTAAMTIGAVRPALEIATRYTAKRKAFGTSINNFQAVGFKVADCVTMLDAARSLVYTTARAIDSGRVSANRIRRMVSESKKFVTDTCWDIANKCMQVMGGIGYTDVYPLERIVRDIRLSQIWVGTNEIMQYIIQSEWYKEYLSEHAGAQVRDVEGDAASAHLDEEKVFE